MLLLEELHMRARARASSRRYDCIWIMDACLMLVVVFTSMFSPVMGASQFIALHQPYSAFFFFFDIFRHNAKQVVQEEHASVTPRSSKKIITDRLTYRPTNRLNRPSKRKVTIKGVLAPAFPPARQSGCRMCLLCQGLVLNSRLTYMSTFSVLP